MDKQFNSSFSIEVVGAPGSGKSTIINRLITQHLPNKVSTSNRLIDKNTSRVNALFLLNKIFRRHQTLTIEKEILSAGARFQSENSEFISKMWNLVSTKISDYRHSDTRFSLAYSFMMGFGRYQYIKEVRKTDYVIFDEGLLHKICNILAESDWPDMETTLQFLPKPAAIILFNPSIDLIVERAAKRKSIMYEQASLMDIENETRRKSANACFVARWMHASYQIPLLELDSGMDHNSNLKRIYAFAHSLK